MRRLAHIVLTAAALGTGAVALWMLGQNPLAAPVVERSTAEVRVALERAMARTVTPDWLLPRLGEALAADDRDRVEMLAGLAGAHGIALPADIAAAVAAVLAPRPFSERASGCAACAVDIHACASLAQMGACALPFEMTVAGDVNALRRQATAAIRDEPVDEIETGLALVGIGATVAVLASGGSSYVVKGGATLVRVARRMGALTPAFGRELGDAARLPVNWDAVLLARPLDEITDTAQLARIGRIAEDFGTLRANTSTAEALVLLRHVDTAQDARRLARLSAAAGPQTRATIEVLGKARAFRALTRVTDLALAFIGVVAALVAQIGSLALSLVLGRLRRLTRPRRRLRPPARRAMIADH